MSLCVDVFRCTRLSLSLCVTLFGVDGKSSSLVDVERDISSIDLSIVSSVNHVTGQ
jgi:hypothetical protein